MITWLAFSVLMSCDPSDATLAELDALEAFDARKEALLPHQNAVLEQANALLERNSDARVFDAWLEFARAYNPKLLGDLLKQRQARATDGKASDPANEYVIARLSSPAERDRLFEKIVQQHTDYAPAWKWLAQSSSYKQRAKAAATLQKLCPNSVWTAYAVIGREPKSKWLAVAKATRSALVPRSSIARARALTEMWAIEKQQSGADQLAVWRGDRALLDEASKSVSVLTARARLAELLGEPSVVNDQLLQDFPYSSQGNEIAAKAAADALSDPLRAKARTAQLVKQFPNYDFASVRLQALRDSDRLNAEEGGELVALSKQLVERDSKLGGPRATISRVRQAQALLLHSLQLELAGSWLDEAEQASKTVELPAAIRTGLELEILAHRMTLARARKDSIALRQLLREYQARDADAEASASALASQGRLFRDEGRFAEALAVLMPQASNRVVRRELDLVWTDLGGTAESLTALLARFSEPVPVARELKWKKLSLAMPAFSLKDTAGKVWTKEGLAGKRVVVALFASWCQPCKEELPHLETLARTTKQKDLVVLGLNVDAEEDAGRQFVADSKLSIPALFGGVALADGLTGSSPIPRMWIVDRVGTIAAESIGFSDLADWQEQVEKAVNTFAP